jgi:hypothetical protein
MKRLGLTLAFVLGMLGVTAVQAGFVGNTVTYDLRHPGIGGSVYGTDTGLIANGTVLGPLYSGQANAVFTDTSILFNNETCCQWIDDVFYVISGTGLGITGVTINWGGTNQPGGLDASDITFDADNIYIDVGGLILDPANYFAINVSFDVPEPAALVLFGIALAGLGFARRKTV